MPIRSPADVANAMNSCVSNRPAVANAHAVLARFRVLKLLILSTAIPANAKNSCAADYTPVQK